MRTFFLLILLTLVPFSFNLAQTADSTKVGSIVEKYLQQKGFSGTILVALEGQAVFQQSYGLAYDATPDPIQNNYHYSIASVTKLFTCIRILQLQEEGKLALEQAIVDYLPMYKSLLSDQITIHHLLLHISGLPQESDRIYRHQSSIENIVETILRKNKSNSFEAFNYNNVDYFLLGLIIEKLTGNSWEEEISQHILIPLEMTASGFLTYGNYPDDFAYSYSFKRSQRRQDPLFHIENFYAAGNMYSTALDLLKLDQALYTDQLLNDSSKRLLEQSYPEYNYVGYSVWNYKYPFVEEQPTVMERRGGILGANVVVVRLTDDRHTIIILSNDDRFNPDSFGDTENLRELLIQGLY